MSCPLCASECLTPFLERKQVPVHQNLLLPTAEAARRIRRGDLRLAACLGCGFVTNTAYDAALMAYGGDYDNDQTWSAYFEAYVDGLIGELIEEGVKGKRVLEIGCGKGYFLRRLCERGGNEGFGVDASYVGPEHLLGGRVTFIRDFYRESHGAFRPDVVVCRHLIEHVPDPVGLLRSVRRTIGERTDVRAYCETPELQWILNNVVVQDFFYEHCSYFTADSLTFAFEAAGFSMARVSHVFSGQYLWAEGVAGTSTHSAQDRAAAAGTLAQSLGVYGRRQADALRAWDAKLRSLRARAPLAVWGAGAKGVTFLNLLDPDALLVDCVVDVSPRKQGCFIPGTGHPVVAPADLASRAIRNVLLMNANYEAEVRTALERLRLDATLHVEEGA